MSPGLHEVARSPLLEVPKWRTDNPFPKVLEEGRGDCRLVEAPPSAEISAPGVPTTAGFDDSLALPHATRPLALPLLLCCSKDTHCVFITAPPRPHLALQETCVVRGKGSVLSLYVHCPPRSCAQHGLSLNAERRVAGRGRKMEASPRAPQRTPRSREVAPRGNCLLGTIIWLPSVSLSYHS